MKFLLIIFLILLFNNLFAQADGDYRSKNSGTWNNAVNWEKYYDNDGGGPNPLGWYAAPDYPGENAGAGTVTIQINHQMTVDNNVSNTIGALTFAGNSTTATSVVFSGGYSMSTSGALTFGGINADAGDQTFNVVDGTFSCASVTMTNTSNNAYDQYLRVNDGSITISSDITNANANQNNIVFDGSGTIYIGGALGTTTSYTRGTGTLHFNGAGDQSIPAWTTYYNLAVSGGGTKSLTGTITVNNNLIISGATFETNTRTLNVTGTTQVDGTFSDNSNTGTNTFTLLVTVGGTGTWSSTTTTTNNRMNFNGGVTNSGTFAAGGSTIANTKKVTANAAMSFITQTCPGSMEIDGTNTVTVSSTFAVTTNLTVKAGSTLSLTGGAASVGGNLTIENTGNLATTSTSTFTVTGTSDISGSFQDDENTAATTFTGLVTVAATGIFDCSGITTDGNLIINGGITQNNTTAGSFEAGTIRVNSTSGFSGAGVIKVNSELRVNGGGVVLTNSCSGALDIDGLLWGSGTFTQGTGGVLKFSSAAAPTVTNVNFSTNANTMNYDGVGAQAIRAITYHNLTVDGGGDKTPAGTITVNNTLTLTNGVIVLGANNLYLGASATAVGGVFSGTNMIKTSGAGIVRKYFDAIGSYIFPVGTNSDYAPATIDITAATFGGGAGTRYVELRTIASKAPSQLDNTYSLSRYWPITSINLSGIDATIDFSYINAEADAGTEVLYIGAYYDGAAWDVTGNVDEGADAISFTYSGLADLDGNYTAGPDYDFVVRTFYSRGDGDWETTATWSTVGLGGAAASTTPVAGCNVVIGGGNTVTKTTSTALSINSLQIDNASVLDMGEQTGLTISTFKNTGTGGNGKVKLYAAAGNATFPTVTTNDFNASTDGTVEYYTANVYNLPATPTAYPKLLISGASTKTIQAGVNTTVNGTLTIENTAQLVTSTGGIAVTGVTQVDGTFTDNNNTGTNTFTGLVTVSVTTGTWTSSAVTTNANMSFNGGVTNNNSFTGGGATIGSGQTITATSAMSFIGFTCPGHLIIDGAGGVTSTAAVTTTGGGNLTVNAGASLTISGGNSSVAGNLSIANTGTFLYSSTGTLGVSGTTQVDGSFTDNSNAAATTFTGLVTIGGTGDWTTTSVTTNGNMIFNGGVTSSGTFNAAGSTIGTTKTVTTNAAMSFITQTCPGSMEIDGTNTVTISSTFAITTNLTVKAGSTLSLTGGAASVGGNLTIENTGSLITTSTSTFAVTGTSDISGTFRDDENTAATTFTGLVTVAATGTFDCSGITTLARLIFNGGITQNNTTAGAFEAGTIRVNATSEFSGAGEIKVSGQLDVNGALVVLTNSCSGGLNVDGLLSGTGSFTQGTGGILKFSSAAAPTVTNVDFSTNANTMNYDGAGAQAIRALTYHNLTVDGSGDKTPAGTITVNNTLTLTNGVIVLGANSLYLGASATAVGGVFTGTNMIKTSGAGIVRKYFDAIGSFIFPVGTNSDYAPATIDITTATFGGGAGTRYVELRTIASKAPSQLDNTYSLSRYWPITSINLSGIDANIDFTYPNADADAGTEALYIGAYYDGAAWDVTGSVDEGADAISFTYSGLADLDGNYTAGPDYDFVVRTFYSRADGNWETASTWSTVALGGAAASTSPVAGCNVIIGNGNTVTKTTSTALSINSLQIDNNSVLDMTNQTGLTISTFKNTGAGGNGKIKLYAAAGNATFPTVTTNDFNSTTDGTVEYYSANTYNLPATPTSYPKLLISGASAKTIQAGVNTTVNGTLTIENTAQLITSTGGVSVTGVTQVDGTFTDNNNTGGNTFTGLVTIGATGTWTSSAVTTNANMAFSSGITNTNSFTGGGATIGSGQTITATSAMTFIGFTCPGHLIITGAGGVTSSAAVTTTGGGNLTVNAGASLTISAGNSSIAGNLSIANTGTFLYSSTGTLGVSGTTQVDGSFTDNENSSATTFTGLVTIGGTGTWTSSSVVTYARMVFNGGVTNTNSFTGGGATIGSGQTITATSAMTFIGFTCPGHLIIAGAGGVTSSAAVTTTAGGNLTVNAGASLTVSAGNSSVAGNLSITNTGTFLYSSTGTFGVTGTTQVDGSFTDNSNANVSTFTGLVTVGATGNWNSISVITDGRIVFTAGITNSGSVSIGGATIGNGGIITANNQVNFTAGLTCSGDVTMTGAGGTVVSGTTPGSIAGNLTINAGSLLNVSTTNTFTVSGTTAVNGSFTDNENTNVTTFTGLVTIGVAGIWNTTGVTTNGRMVFLNGITQNNTTAGSFTAGSARFQTNTPQTISGAGSLSFANNVGVIGAVVLNNNNTGTITISGNLDGNNAASEWVNAADATVVIGGTAVPFTNGGILTATAVNNLVKYNSTTTTTVFPTTYYNLTIATGSTSTLSAAATVNGTLYLLTGSFSIGSNLTMGDGSTINRANGSLTAAPTFGASVHIIYSASCVTGFEVPSAVTVLNNLTMNTSGGDVTLGANMTVNGVFTWSSAGLLILSTYNLTMATGSSFSGQAAGKYIQTNSSGYLKKEGAADTDFEITYPVGTTVYYTPMQITDVTSADFGSPGNVTVRAVGSRLSYVPVSNNALTKYWVVASSFTVATVNVNYTFDPAEVVGSVTNYEPRIGDGATLYTVTVPSAPGSTPTFSSTGNNTLTGDWTYIDPTVVSPKTYYSYQSGDWSDTDTWTTDPTGNDWIDPGIPGSLALDDVVILIGRTVTTGTARNVNSVTINSGGTLDIGTTTGHNYGTISGQGTIKLKSVTLPTADFSTFVASGGGTVEYYDYGGAGTNLPAVQLTYCNLTISNTTGTNNKLIVPNPTNPTTFILNGNLTLSATGAGTTTLQFGYTATNVINATLSGSITNGTGCYITVGNFNAIHNITLNGNLTNDGSIDWSNSAQFTASTNGAVNLTFTGASDKSFTCNGQTDIYSLTVNIGTDNTYTLEITTADVTYFKIFTNTQNITLTKGTLKLSSNVSLVRMGVTNSQFFVNTGCRLWINGATVNTNARDDGLAIVGGIFKMTSGTAVFSDYGLNFGNSGQVLLSGGTLTVEQLICGGAGTNDGYFEISGGTFNLDASLNGGGVADLGRFSLPDPNSSFNMSGGTINIYDPENTTQITNAGISIATGPTKYSVTGGTWNLYIPASSVDFGIASTIPFYDMNIYKEGAGTAVAKLMTIGGDFIVSAQPLVILHDLTIDGTNSPVLDANGYNVTVGGNFTISSGGEYRPNANTTTFNGPQTYGRTSQTFTIDQQITKKTDVVIDKSSGTLSLAGSASFDCLGGLTLTSGTLDDGGKTIDVCGNISNSTTHTGTGSIRVQRGVTAGTVTAGGSYTLPTMTVSAGTETTPATFGLTIKNGVITNISVVSGGSYSVNGSNRTITFAGGSGAGASALCETVGGAVNNVWILSGGSGYGPSASDAGDGGGSGVVLEAVITGNTSTVAGTATLSSINITATGEGYTSNPTITISGGGGGTASSVTDAVLTIGGSGTGVFNNLSLNNNIGYSLTAKQTLTGDLRLAQGVMNISSYNLALGGSSHIYDALAGTGTTFTTTKMIKTNGLASNAGLTKTYSASMLGFTFPLGTGTEYTPATITLDAAPTAYGSITVRPVSSEHPQVVTTGRSITYYWKTISAGMTLGTATVSQVYKYDDTDIITGGDITEDGYVAARYNPSTITWTKSTDVDVDEGTNLITFSNAIFNTTIDGEYTAGDDVGTDPFGVILMFYSKGNSNWQDGNNWSVVSHDGIASGTWPGANSVVQIGDATHNHTITAGTNSIASGTIRIANGSALDMGTYTSHNLGYYINHPDGDGKIRISSSAATAEFPAGDVTDFIGSSGGTVEYYTSGSSFSIPATSAAPSSLSLNTYKNLLLVPEALQTITLPDMNMTVYNDLTVSGAASNALVYINSASVKTMSITNNLVETGGNLQFRNGSAQAWTVGNDISVSSGALLDVENAGATTHTLSVGGSLTNNGTLDFNQASDCNLTFTGSNDESFTGTNAGASTDLNKLTINKGSTQTPVLTMDVLGTLTTPNPTGSWLTLTNGTFRFAKASTLTISNVAGETFTIPGTSCLSVNNASATVELSKINSNTADVFLTGKLEILDGAVTVGNNNNTTNDIEYSQVGTPEIDIQGGSLTVTGLIRRPTTSTAGSLTYKQSGTGAVTIRGRGGETTRAKLEITNSGIFNMSGTSTLTILRSGGTTFGDLYLLPASSSVTGGTIILGTTNLNTNRTFTMNSNITLNNLTISGVDADDNATVTLSVNGLTLIGTLTISNQFSVFNANGLNVTFTGSGALSNSNTDAGTGVTTGGYRAGTLTQNTTFNSSTASQTITGTAGNLTNFGNLVLSNTFGSVTLAANTNIRVNGNLSLSNCTFADGGNTATVTGNITNSSTHSGAGKIKLNGSAQQTITGSGSGVFQNMEINNSNGAIATANFTMNGAMTFTAGIIDMDQYKLTFGESASIAGTPGSSSMIITNGVISDAGIVKNYPAGASDFTFPVGSGSIYTPARFNVTANTATGTITIKPVNIQHPSTQDVGELELDYYWNVTTTGFAGYTVTHVYTYDQSDVNGTETNYVTGRFYGSDWTPALGIASTVNDIANTMTLTGVNYFDGDYTAGETAEFAGLLIYYSRNATSGGNWDDGNNWSTDAINQHDGAACGTYPPGGNAVVIANGHTVNANGNSRRAVRTELYGTLNLSNYIGQNLGTVTGTGTIIITATAGGSFVFPSGIYTSFTDVGGGAFEFGGSTNGTLPIRSSYNNFKISGTATKTLPAGNVTIKGDITISSGILNNSTNNINIEAKGDWINTAGSTAFTAGTGTVTFNGSGAQEISGLTTFKNVTLSDASQITITGNPTITGVLTLSTGKLNLGAGSITIGTSGTLAGITAVKYIQADGAGFLKKTYNATNTSFVFPVGDVDEYSPVTVSFNSATVWGTIEINVTDAAHGSMNTTGTSYITRWWEINGSGFTNPNYNFDAVYLNADIVGTETDIFGALWSGGNWYKGKVAETDGANTLSRDNNNTFSNLAGGSIGALPIELLSFTGEIINGNAELEWITASEKNNDFFTIQKSKDAKIFEETGRISGAGNSNTILKYSFTDPMIDPGITYYRLKQTDYNGNFSYSSIVAINKITGSIPVNMIVYPNPVPSGQKFIINFQGVQPGEKVLIIVKNMLGDELYSNVLIVESSNGIIEAIDTENNLTPGIYIITGSSNNSIFSKKIIIK